MGARTVIPNQGEAPLGAALQLTIDDALEQLELDRQAADDGFGMSRIGEGLELGMTLLQPLLMKGWKLHGVDEPITAFAGGGRLFILRHGTTGIEVRAEGATVGDVACELMEKAAPWTPWTREEE